MSYGLVWFKRDLRLADHAAFAAAARRGPVLCVLIVEPALWAHPDAARQHYEFMLESARELHAELRQRGGRLHLMVGEAVEEVRGGDVADDTTFLSSYLVQIPVEQEQ